MAPTQFEQTLRRFLRSDPFQPFIIELEDGKQLLIDARHTVSLGTEAAGFIDPNYEIHFFRCEQVRDIRLPAPQPTS